MPQFHYKAKQGPRQVIDGIIDAATLDQAVAKVIQSGLVPVDVVPVQVNSVLSAAARPEGGGWVLWSAVRFQDVVAFTRQMSDMIESSVPVLRALQIVSRQWNHPRFRDILQTMTDVVRDGGAFSTALAQHPRVFSPLYVNLVKTGEVSGQLETVMARLAVYLEKEQDNRGKIRNSLAYPGLVFVVGILTVFVLLSFVVPRLSLIFEDLGQNLPWPTVVLLAVSDVFARFWWMILPGTLLGGYYLYRWFKTEQGRFFRDQQFLQSPVIGNFIRAMEVSRFSLTLGTLVESGVGITTALDSVWSTVDNMVLRYNLREVSAMVANGMSLRQALERGQFYPDMAVSMIAVGEETGKLDRSLYKIAEMYGRQADEQMKGMLSLLGPAALIVIVLFVGFIVVALLLPIFQMNLLVQ